MVGWADESSSLNALVLASTDLVSTLPRDAFETYGFRVSYAQTIGQAKEIFDQQATDTAFLPLQTGADTTLSLIRHMLEKDPTMPIIIIAQNDQINDAADAMRLGAFDCIFVPFSKTRLEKTISGIRDRLSSSSRHKAGNTPHTAQAQTARGTQGNRQSNRRGLTGSKSDYLWAPEQLRAPRAVLDDLPIQPLIRALNAVSSSRAPVFIRGESGTGKHALARAIHAESGRAGDPFVVLDCATLSDDHLAGQILSQSERIIDKATLLFEDIAQMPGSLQPRLTRFIDTGDISAIGGHRRTKLNIRVISTSTTDPRDDIRAGRLDKELFHRLCAVPIHLPALRDCQQDLMAVADAKLRHMSTQQNRQFRGFSDDARAAICAYRWPGNIRQLAQVIEQIVLTNNARQVSYDMLPQALLDQTEKPSVAATHHQDLARSGLLGRSLADIERIVIEETIRAQKGSLPKAAQILGVAPSTLYRKREGWLNN